MKLEELERIESEMMRGPWSIDTTLNFLDSPFKFGIQSDYDDLREGRYLGSRNFKFENAEGIVAMRNAFPKLLAVAKAAKDRLRMGCNDTCGKALHPDYGCNCGNDELRKAFEELENV